MHRPHRNNMQDDNYYLSFCPPDDGIAKSNLQNVNYVGQLTTDQTNSTAVIFDIGMCPCTVQKFQH